MSQVNEMVIQLVVKSKTGAESRGSCEIEILSDVERRGRALKISGGLLGGAVFSIFLPIAHFVLVPGFLTASFISFFRIWRNDRKIKFLQLQCPVCKRDFHVKEKFGIFPLQLNCELCNVPLFIGEASDS